jgi:RimJ/RimL family protein N-acetyltransferase
MKVELLSAEYKVKQIEEEDIQKVYDLCKSNPLYYQYCPPFVTVESIKEDLMALPKGKTLKDKYYVGFYTDKTLIAVMDIISGYPNSETAFIGFFMMNQHMQGKGVGTAIITEACQYFKKAGFTYARLGFVKGNPQSEAFWTRNHFEKTGVEVQAKGYVIVVMQRRL